MHITNLWASHTTDNLYIGMSGCRIVKGFTKRETWKITLSSNRNVNFPTYRSKNLYWQQCARSAEEDSLCWDGHKGDTCEYCCHHDYCNDEPPRPPRSCETTECDDNKICMYDPNGEPICVCAEGYRPQGGHCVPGIVAEFIDSTFEWFLFKLSNLVKNSRFTDYYSLTGITC